MSDTKIVQFRRGTTVQTNVFTGAPGEITVDTDTWAAVVHDGHTPGGHPLRVDAVEFPRVRYLIYRAAAVQQGIASLGFSAPLNSPLPIVISDGSGIIVGAARFDAHENQAVQDHFLLPDSWVSPLELDIVWRVNTTIGTVTWNFQTCCVPTGDVLEDQNFGPIQRVSTITSGIPNAITTSTLEIDTTGFPPDGELFFQLTHDGGDDTVASPVELLTVRFTIRIQEK